MQTFTKVVRTFRTGRLILKGGGHLSLSLALLSKKDSGQPLCRVVPGTV